MDVRQTVEVFTLWGEVAWQLAGKDGYALVSGADHSGTSPGGALAELLSACSPCLVLIDEWVAYARQLYGSDRHLSGGTFDAHVSFAQALTEAARATEGALLVVSLPASVNLADRDKDAPGVRQLQHRARRPRRGRGTAAPAGRHGPYRVFLAPGLGRRGL